MDTLVLVEAAEVLLATALHFIRNSHDHLIINPVHTLNITVLKEKRK